MSEFPPFAVQALRRVAPISMALAGLVAAPAALAGAVYTETNAVEGNQILILDVDASTGTLAPVAHVDTGGLGTGAGLGSQGALAFARNGRLLLAVNAGSDDVSVFRVDGSQLYLAEVEHTLGTTPISVAAYGNLVYVLNAGSDSLAGFRLGAGGQLTPLDDATRPLSGAGVAGAQVGFTPDGSQVIVTEKASGLILSYPVEADGTLGTPAQTPSPTPTPFGFDFGRRDLMFVSEAAGGATDAATLSSYRVGLDMPELLTASAPTTESAACWVVVSHNGRYAYTTNTGSGTVTGFAVGLGGSLTLLDDDGATGIMSAGSRPIDADFSGDDDYLYVLDGAGPSIGVFAKGSDGSLGTVQQLVLDVPSAVGLLAQ